MKSEVETTINDVVATTMSEALKRAEGRISDALVVSVEIDTDTVYLKFEIDSKQVIIWFQRAYGRCHKDK